MLWHEVMLEEGGFQWVGKAMGIWHEEKRGTWGYYIYIYISHSIATDPDAYGYSAPAYAYAEGSLFGRAIGGQCDTMCRDACVDDQTCMSSRSF